MINETVVVFGASGFLGSHVADALTAAGYRVRLFDRSPSPYLQSNQEMIIGDIMNPGSSHRSRQGSIHRL
jgi:UDP-glucose 4-epimerase